MHGDPISIKALLLQFLPFDKTFPTVVDLPDRLQC